MGLFRREPREYPADPSSYPAGGTAHLSHRPSVRFSDPFAAMWTNWVAGTSDTSVLTARVSRAEALAVPAVLRARNLIAGTLGSLPVETHDKTRALVRSPFLDQIDPNIPNSVTLAATYEDLLFEGLAWWQITGFGWDGFPAAARHVDVREVSLSPPQGVVQNMLPSGQFPGGVVWVHGKVVDGRNMIRFDSLNPPLLTHGARAIRTALALDAAASNYANTPRPLGMFTPADGADPEDTAVQAALDAWEEARQTRADGYVGAGLKYTPMSWNPAELQLAEGRQHAVLEIARATGIDPEDLGVSTTSRTYANAIDRRIDFVNQTLAPYAKAISDRLSMGDVTPRGQYVCVDLDDFLKADPTTRWGTYQVGTAIGALTVEEVREAEELPAMTPAQRADAAPDPVPQSTVDASQPATATFARADGISFDTEATAAAFTVDEQARTITGLAVPYGAVARSGGARWRFQAGSLKWRDPSRVKLLQDHDAKRAVGRAVKLDDRADGLWATFKVGRGTDGDAALESAADGVRDGLSVGIDFTDSPDDIVTDPADPTVQLVRRAALREVTLTAMPAFDDSRVTGVAASSTERDLTMTAPAEPTAAPDLTAFTAAVEAAFTGALEKLTVPQRDTVNPTTHLQHIREPLVYSMNGSGPSFVRDAWTARTERFGPAADEAQARLRKYQEQTAELSAQEYATFANAGNTTDQAQIIPPGYRPDLYVGQVPQGRPLAESMSRGVLTDATPFKVPVFVNAASLSGTNTEGTNPTTGTITNHTYVTVTPTAQSGLFTISRELIDAANPAIDAIARAAMQEEYARDTEAIIKTALEAATDNDTGSGQSTEGCYVDTSSGDDKDFVLALRGSMGEFPFRRFLGPNRLVLAHAGWSSAVNAVDDVGRPLLTSRGPQNVLGGVGTAAQSLDVEGLAGVPAWALGTTNDAYIYNAVDAWVWESPLLQFRFEEKNGPANIDLAIWGYFAFQILRFTGITALNHTS